MPHCRGRTSDLTILALLLALGLTLGCGASTVAGEPTPATHGSAERYRGLGAPMTAVALELEARPRANISAELGETPSNSSYLDWCSFRRRPPNAMGDDPAPHGCSSGAQWSAFLPRLRQGGMVGMPVRDEFLVLFSRSRVAELLVGPVSGFGLQWARLHGLIASDARLLRQSTLPQGCTVWLLRSAELQHSADKAGRYLALDYGGGDYGEVTSWKRIYIQVIRDWGLFSEIRMTSQASTAGVCAH